jgi:FSR family fosmidomycin resistance protein-like MFS transporter
MKTVEASRRGRSALVRTEAPPTPLPRRELARVIAVVMMRSWAFLSLLQFLPIWYAALGYDGAFYGTLATVVILSGVAGTLVGGALADRIGGRAVIVGSQLVCVPALLLWGGYPGGVAFLVGAVFGFSSDASLSVTLASAQRLLPGRTGIASGVILGLGFITAGIGVPITGIVADRFGVGPAMMCLAATGVVAAVLGATIPRALLEVSPMPATGEVTS